jgi:stress-induced-phosphoprotein 1
LNPNNHNLYHSRSLAYDKLGEFNDSLVDAEKAISLKKDWPKNYFIKGNALEHLKKYDEAINTYEEGLHYDANDESLKEALKNFKNFFKSKKKT